MSEKKIDDGGPAFPIPISCDSMGGIQESRFEGLSIRDWFAGRALQGFLAADLKCSCNESVSSITSKAYYIADAMLSAREKE